LYSQADRDEIRARLKKRWLVTAVPSGLALLCAAAVFVICQAQRKDWGWIVACAVTILAGACFIFLYGVYLRPMRLYGRHVTYMLEGRMRETTGVLTEIADLPADKDGLDFFAITVNVGEKGEPEDDRLLYYDALKGKPNFAVGAHVTALSNDRMVSDLRGA
jgi:hypothetical protein